MKNLLELLLVLILALFAAAPVQAQEWQENLRSQPGYVDFGNLPELLGAEPKVVVELGGPLLTFLSASTEQDPQLATMLETLKGIRVFVFELNNGDAEAARAKVEELASRLKASDWQRTIQVNDPASPVSMFIKTDGGQIAGLTMMVVSGNSEAVFINIVGQVDPAALGHLAARFGVSVDMFPGTVKTPAASKDTSPSS